MKKEISYKITSIAFGVLILCFVIAFYAIAWEEPTEAPPGGNVPVPINVGDVTQYKEGALGIGGLFQTDNETHLAISGGNVGIGTTSPNANLEIVGTGATDRELAIYSNRTIGSGESGPPQVLIDSFSLGGVGDPGIEFVNKDGNHAIIKYDGDLPKGLSFRTAGMTSSDTIMHIGDNGDILLAVNRGGNVGIGTTNPDHKLTIADNGNLINIKPFDARRNAGIELRNNESCDVAGGCSAYIGFRVGDDAGRVWYSDNPLAGYKGLALFGNYVEEAPGFDPGIFINSVQRVGIGTTNPQYKLDVEGDAQAHSWHTGDIYFQKDGEELWRMFEDEDGLYLESPKTGKVYKILMEEVED